MQKISKKYLDETQTFIRFNRLNAKAKLKIENSWAGLFLFNKIAIIVSDTNKIVNTYLGGKQ